jgi:hypothetical protein
MSWSCVLAATSTQGNKKPRPLAQDALRQGRGKGKESQYACCSRNRPPHTDALGRYGGETKDRMATQISSLHLYDSTGRLPLSRAISDNCSHRLPPLKLQACNFRRALHGQAWTERRRSPRHLGNEKVAIGERPTVAAQRWVRLIGGIATSPLPYVLAAMRVARGPVPSYHQAPFRDTE